MIESLGKITSIDGIPDSKTLDEMSVSAWSKWLTARSTGYDLYVGVDLDRMINPYCIVAVALHSCLPNTCKRASAVAWGMLYKFLNQTTDSTLSSDELGSIGVTASLLASFVRDPSLADHTPTAIAPDVLSEVATLIDSRADKPVNYWEGRLLSELLYLIEQFGGGSSENVIKSYLRKVDTCRAALEIWLRRYQRCDKQIEGWAALLENLPQGELEICAALSEYQTRYGAQELVILLTRLADDITPTSALALRELDIYRQCFVD